jgi:RimJ/RimL family protein N-acetyltransferase
MLLLWPAGERVRIHAERMVLREWTLEDAPAMVGLFDTDEMNRWTPLPSPFDLNTATRYVEAANRHRGESGSL